MSHSKVNYSIYFADSSSEPRFLFQIVNFGRNTDELKFTFTSLNEGVGAIYSDTHDSYSGSMLIRSVPEISYHADGSLLYKLPRTQSDFRTIHINPKSPGVRRTPLAELKFWEPVFRYTIYSYDLCKKGESTNRIDLPSNTTLFNGQPFEIISFLGRTTNIMPLAPPGQLAFRLPDIGDKLDLLICGYRINETGKMMKVEGTETMVWSTNNVITVVESTIPRSTDLP